MPGSIGAWFEHRNPGDLDTLTSPGLVEHFFRREYGRLVAMLTRRVGVRHIELVEDAVQAALTAALTSWTYRDPPQDPGAWLYRVAYNHLMGELRLKANRLRILEQGREDLPGKDAEPFSPGFEGEVADDLLRMLFICCDEEIPPESQLVLALKTLCGFTASEIALRLFTTEANVHKRLARARNRLRTISPEVEAPPLAVLAGRLPNVHEVLYLLFNEGYLSAHEEQAIRSELCHEAIRLATLLENHPVGSRPETFALLALMHLHTARLASRQDRAGGLLLLEEQDRSLWDQGRIRLGMEYLGKASSGSVFSHFHAEAGIAAEHCLAPSFKQTRWSEIVDLYSMLEAVSPSPLHILNKAVAIAQWKGPEMGLALLQGLAPPSWLAGSYLWDAVLSDLNRRSGNIDIARQHLDRALDSAPTEAVRELLRRRLFKAE